MVRIDDGDEELDDREAVAHGREDGEPRRAAYGIVLSRARIVMRCRYRFGTDTMHEGRWLVATALLDPLSQERR